MADKVPRLTRRAERLVEPCHTNGAGASRHNRYRRNNPQGWRTDGRESANNTENVGQLRPARMGLTTAKRFSSTDDYPYRRHCRYAPRLVAMRGPTCRYAPADLSLRSG